MNSWLKQRSQIVRQIRIGVGPIEDERPSKIELRVRTYKDTIERKGYLEDIGRQFKIHLDHLFVIYPGKHEFPLAEEITARGISHHFWN